MASICLGLNVLTLINPCDLQTPYGNVGSGNSLSHVWHQAITWTSNDVLLAQALMINHCDILHKMLNFLSRQSI